MKIGSGRMIWAALFTVVASAAWAQYGAGSPVSGYGEDQNDLAFEDEPMKVERKESSMWWDPVEKTPAAQLARGKRLEAEGSLRYARNAYNALVHEWHASPEAATAQMAVARLYEARGNLERAYEENLYLAVYFAGQCPYDEVLDRTFRMANALLHDNKSFLGLELAGNESLRENFERILHYAPRWHRAPEAMMIVAALHESDKAYADAARVYDGLIMRWPMSPQVQEAAVHSATCHHAAAMRQKENEPRCRDAIMAINALLGRFPHHAEREKIEALRDELVTMRMELNYKQACFYDSPQRSTAAAVTAYRRFIREFPDSKYVAAVRTRLEQLEAAPQSAKKPVETKPEAVEVRQ